MSAQVAGSEPARSFIMLARKGLCRRACGALILFLSQSAAASLREDDWLDFGGAVPNLNHRKQLHSTINSNTVQGLQDLFDVEVGADVSATPAVVNGVVYFPDWKGYLWALDSNTGATIWKQQLKSLLPGSAQPGPGAIVSRNTPAIDLTHNMMVIGTQSANSSLGGRYAFIMAIRLTDGKLAWVNSESANYHPYASISASLTVYDGAAYVGVASLEELVAAPTYKCCTFRGSLIKLRVEDGAQVWQTFTTPSPPKNDPAGGFSGNAVWGSAPAIDTQRQLVYIGTGNNYKVPDNVVQCLNDPKKTNPEKAACQGVPGNWYDAILAISIETGKIVWGSRRSFFDVWTVFCLDPTQGATCPVKASDDYDFGQAPLYFSGISCPSKGKVDLLVASAKSGITYGLDISTARNGNAPKDFWPPADTGVGSFDGGAQWGSATDGKTTLFVQNTNALQQAHVLINPAPNSVKNTTAGFVSAIDLCTGKIKWQAAAPNGARLFAPPAFIGHSLDDGVVALPSMTLTPNTTEGAALYFFQASTGQLLLQLPLDRNSACGPAVAEDTVYLGDGYSHFAGIGLPGKHFYAYRLPKPRRSPPHNKSPLPVKMTGPLPPFAYSG